MRRLSVLVFVWIAPIVAEAAQPISAPGSYPPGEYYLAEDITITSGFALNFAAETIYDRVDLNLNGKTIRCITSGNDETFGVLGSGPANLIVRGGGASWIDGCRIGVSSSRYTRIQEVNFTNIKYMAMNLSGPISRVILNSVETVGGVTDEAYSVGVNVTGPTAIIRANRFMNLYRQAGAASELSGEGVPIILGHGVTSSLVELNYLSNETLTTSSIGIFASGSGHVIRCNTIRNFMYGLELGGAGTVELNNLILSEPSQEGVGTSVVAAALVQDNTFVGYAEGRAIRIR